MAKLVLSVKRVEDEYQNVVLAAIVVYANGPSVEFEVRAKNKHIKNHLEQLLSSPFYLIAPGPRTSAGYFANHAEYQYPGTFGFYLWLADRLGWYGYIADFVNRQDLQKSLHSDIEYDDYEDDETSPVLKSVAAGAPQQFLRQNQKGETIVERVPPGYVAISIEGKVVGPGKYLNANISKEGAKWRLMQAAPQMQQMGASPEGRKQLFTKLMASKRGQEEYHPVYHPEVHEKDRMEFSRTHMFYRELMAAYEKATPLEKVIEGMITQKIASINPKGSEILPEYVLAYSPSKRILVPGHQFPVQQKLADDWVLFDGRGFYDLSHESRAKFREQHLKQYGKIHPALLQNAFYHAQTIENPEIIDLEEAVPYQIADLYKNRLTSARKFVEREKTAFDMEEGDIDESATLGDEIRQVDVSKEQKAKIQTINEHDRALLRQFFQETPDGMVPREGLEPLKDIAKIAPGPERFHSPEGLRPYQEYMVRLATHESRYRYWGGPDEVEGHFFNLAQGLGKTPTLLAADAIMRNKGLFKGTTLIVCPRTITTKWADDIRAFRGEDAIIIDGTPEERERLWKRIARMAAEGQPPKYVIMGAGKIYYESNQENPSEDPTYDPSLDLKYVQVLASGFSVNGKKVENGIFSCLTVDETGLFTNPGTNRGQSLRKMVNWITSDRNRGVVWTLSGDISGNSALDTLVELGWTNAAIRNNIPGIADIFTKKVSKVHERRVWKAARAFLDRFGHSVTSLTKRMAVGEDRRTKMDAPMGIGEEFYEVYNDAFGKFRALCSMTKESNHDIPLANYKLGLIMVMLQAAHNVSHPQRIIEYDVGAKTLLDSVRKKLSGDDLAKFDAEIRQYMRMATQMTEIGRMPKADELPTEERDKLWEKTISPEFRELMRDVLELDWYNPIAEAITDQLSAILKGSKKTDAPIRFGMAGMSRMAMESLYRRLRKTFDSSKLRLHIITGSTTAEEVRRIQADHALKPGKDKNGNPQHLPPVLTMVTGAGNYGINLPSDIAWRFATWSSAKGQQYENRFHRNPYDFVAITRLVCSGVGSFMAALEDRKYKMADIMQNVNAAKNLDALESEEEVMGSLFKDMSEKTLLENLERFTPMVIRRPR